MPSTLESSPLLSTSSSRLVTSLAVVTRSRYNNPRVDVVLASGLVTTLGLTKDISRLHRTDMECVAKLTGVPQGLTG